MEKTKIALVFPRGGNLVMGIPLAFGYLKSNTDDSKYDIKIIDCTLENLDPSSSDFIDRIKQINPEVVGVSSWSFSSPEALLVLRVIKRVNPNITTIWGGCHATVFAKRVIQNKEVDFVFRGEAERAFSKFLDERNKVSPDFSQVEGLIYKNEKGGIYLISNEIARIDNLDDVKIPDYDSMNLNGYIEKGYRYFNSKARCAPIWATRGCPYRCAFCSAPIISGRKLRKHSVEYLIHWIKLLYAKYDIRGFNIIDDNFTFDIEYAKSFCQEVIKLGYKDVEFNCPNGIRMQRGDTELWSLMWRAGWRTLIVAPESGSQRVLKSLNKDLDVSIVPKVVSDIKEAGLEAHGFFMIGCPGETREDIEMTEALIRKSKFTSYSVANFQPLPGTLIYDDLVKKGEISSDFLPDVVVNDLRNRSYTPATLKDFDFAEFADHLQLYAADANLPVFLRTQIKSVIQQPQRILHLSAVFRVLLAIARIYLRRVTYPLWRVTRRW